MKSKNVLYELAQAGQILVGIISLKLMFDSLRGNKKQQDMLNELNLKIDLLTRRRG